MSTFTRVFLILILHFAQSYCEDIVSLCNSGFGYHKEITDYKPIRMRIKTSVWPDSMLSCTMVFKANDRSDDLFYEFDSFHLNDVGTTLQFESTSFTSYSPEATYSQRNKPITDLRKRTNTYLKVTIKRASSSETSLTASFNVFTEDYSTVIWNPRLGLTLGTIIGIVAGLICLIIFIVLVTCCLCAKSRRRGIVMPPGSRVATTTTMASSYPYGPPPEHYAMHPVYPGHQMAVYPPGVYPAPLAAPHSGPPPGYNELASIRNAHPKVESTAGHR